MSGCASRPTINGPESDAEMAFAARAHPSAASRPRSAGRAVRMDPPTIGREALRHGWVRVLRAEHHSTMRPLGLYPGEMAEIHLALEGLRRRAPHALGQKCFEPHARAPRAPAGAASGAWRCHGNSSATCRPVRPRARSWAWRKPLQQETTETPSGGYAEDISLFSATIALWRKNCLFWGASRFQEPHLPCPRFM